MMAWRPMPSKTSFVASSRIGLPRGGQTRTRMAPYPAQGPGRPVARRPQEAFSDLVSRLADSHRGTAAEAVSRSGLKIIIRRINSDGGI